MKDVSADSSCSVWWDSRAACAEVSTGPVEASKAKHSPEQHMLLGTTLVAQYIQKKVYKKCIKFKIT
jgi:hypothetical protein